MLVLSLSVSVSASVSASVSVSVSASVSVSVSVPVAGEPHPPLALLYILFLSFFLSRLSLAFPCLVLPWFSPCLKVSASDLALVELVLVCGLDETPGNWQVTERQRQDKETPYRIVCYRMLSYVSCYVVVCYLVSSGLVWSYLILSYLI